MAGNGKEEGKGKLTNARKKRRERNKEKNELKKTK